MVDTKKIDRSTDKKGLPYVTILGIKVNSTSKDELLNVVREKISRKIQFFIVTPNPEIILQTQSNPALAHSLNSADISLPDGVGLKLAESKLITIKGREFMLDLFKLADAKHLKVYLFGSTMKVIEKSLSILVSQYPNIEAKGNSGPKLDDKCQPVSEVDIKLQSDVVKEINTFKPDLLFVAFGAPKQELWISNHLKDLNVMGAMAVGGALDYYSGVVRPVPNFLQNFGLEWLWRLLQEPKRMGRIFNASVKWPLTILLHRALK